MDKADKIIRFDDVCVNSSFYDTEGISNIFASKGFKVIWAVSPMVHKMVNDGVDRVYPKILNALSDYRVFYNVDECIISPAVSTIKISWIQIASHGIVHVDHRLLDFGAQEMSILVSCSLLKSKIFVPPFNKWNKYTEQICKENGIELVKFEDGWKCCEYNEYDPNHNWWYLHAREWTLEKIQKWLGH